MAVTASSPENMWMQTINVHINRAWTKPPSLPERLRCEVSVTQDRAGQVSAVGIQECDGDDAVRRSIEEALHRASPLPPPLDPDIFTPNLRILITRGLLTATLPEPRPGASAPAGPAAGGSGEKSSSSSTDR
jgi:colicin import membrane protein